MLMIESEDQSLFLGFISLPPIGFMPLVRWNYNPAKSRSDRSTIRGRTFPHLFSFFQLLFHFLIFHSSTFFNWFNTARTMELQPAKSRSDRSTIKGGLFPASFFSIFSLLLFFFCNDFFIFSYRVYDGITTWPNRGQTGQLRGATFSEFFSSILSS